MRAVVADFAATGAKARYGGLNFLQNLRHTVLFLGDVADFVVHEALKTGNRACLHHKERRTDFDVAVFGFQKFEHARKKVAHHGLGQGFLVFVDERHKAGHVRALVLGRKAHVHTGLGNRRLRAVNALDGHRNRKTPHAHAVNGDAACVNRALHIGQRLFASRCSHMLSR